MPDRVARLILVIGPPGAGKSTWARARARQADGPWYLIDGDALMDGVLARRSYAAIAKRFTTHLYDRAIDFAIEHRLSCIVTMTGATKRYRARALDRFVAAEYAWGVVCLAPADAAVAISRAVSDPKRPASSKKYWPAIVHHWYRDYEPPPGVRYIST